MAILNRDLLVGLLAGVALTLVALNAWGVYSQRELFEVAQVHPLQPLGSPKLAALQKSVEGIQPWLPQTSGQGHDSWKLRGMDGKEVTLADFRGRVVFLDVWSTTCLPCLAEMPAIERLQDSVKQEQVAFLAVTLEEEKPVREFLRGHPIGIPVYFGSEDMPEDLRAGAFPTTFILDPSGAAVLREMGMSNWDHDSVRSFLRRLQRPGA